MAETPTSGRVAYFSSWYPGLSQAFLDREVDALRARGTDVITLSVHPLPEEERRLTYLRARAAMTDSVRAGGVGRLLRRFAVCSALYPLPLLRGLLRALRTGPPGVRARLRQLSHLVEAVTLLRLLDLHETQHVHVHVADGAADIARAAVALGNDCDGGGWSWSLAVHGPAELADPTGLDLPGKVASASFVACVSEHCRDELAGLVAGEDLDKLHVVRLGVDAVAYRPREPAVRRSCPGDPLRVLFVGRLVPEKAPGALVEVAALLRDSGIDVVVDIVGTGPLRKALAEAIVSYGVADRVRLAGPLGQDELPLRYAAADVFCLPSLAEGLPVVLMEAMASGLPVVTTRLSAIPELVSNGVSGLLVPPGRVEELADALATLDGAPARRDELGAAGRRRVLSEFDPDRNAARLAALLPAEPELPASDVPAESVAGADRAAGVRARPALATPGVPAARTARPAPSGESSAGAVEPTAT